MLSHYIEILMEFLHKSVIKASPPFEFLSNLYRVHNTFNLNWNEENESSSLVSEISNMSILVSVMKENASKLFLLN